MKKYTISANTNNGLNHYIKTSADWSFAPTLDNKEARRLKSYHEYNNGDWKYKDKQNFAHLFSREEGIELTKSVRAVECWPYTNGFWGYKDEKGFMYLFRRTGNGEWVQATKRVKPMGSDLSNTGSWGYHNGSIFITYIERS